MENMKRKFFKNFASIAIAILVIIPVFSLAILPVSAALDPGDLGTEYAENIGLGETDPRDIAANVIKVLLGFLGIIAVLMILIGGFKWMTAGGNDDKVGEARKIIVAGIIGLVIILAAWGIANFVISQLLEATGA